MNTDYNPYNIPYNQQNTQQNKEQTQQEQMQQEQISKEQQNKQDEKIANKLCIASIACAAVPELLSPVYNVLIANSTEIVPRILGGSAFLFYLASLVLMIYVRVKYPKNAFGKVLMWVYIIGVALGIISIILLIVACASLFKSCPG